MAKENMKIMDIEEELNKLAKHVEKSKLIQKCREVAEKLGANISKKSSDSEWANAHYIFEDADSKVKIDYEIFGMGDEQIKVYKAGLEVFSVDEKVTSSPTYPNPLVKIPGAQFELLTYKGEPYSIDRWENKIEDLYHKLTTNVSKSQMKDVKSRFMFIPK